MMKIQFSTSKDRGLTLFEVLLVIVVSLILLAILFSDRILLSGHRQSAVRARRISCVNNLKQVGLAFRIWSGDCGDKFPMGVSVTNGGTMELVERGVVWRHFEVMSNELNMPRILFCPADSDPKRTQANVFESPGLPMSSGTIPFAGDSNTSYFVGVDAVDTNPAMFLAGDRNVTVNNIALSPGLHSLSTNELIGWSREMHINQGNVLMADGSVQQFSQSGLRRALENTGVTTNRLAMP